jgi:hypothetical protein
VNGGEPRRGNSHNGELRGENPYGAGPAFGRARTDGHAVTAREGFTRTPTDIREEVRRLIDARNPEAALFAAAFYLQEADRLSVEAAHQFSEARRVADNADRDHAEAVAERQRLAREWRELERARHEHEVLLDQAFQSLEAREAAVQVAECELQKRTRRRAVEAVVAPELPDTGQQHLRPDSSRVVTPPDFWALLRAFHVWLGRRSYRDIATAGRMSPSTVGNILRGTTPLDRWEVVHFFVVGCGGNEKDLEDVASAWRCVFVPQVESTLTDLPPIRREMEWTEGDGAI